MLIQATSPADIEIVRTLFREYADSLDVDLCFQGFAEELASLPGKYAPPLGCLLLARNGDEAVGCVAVRPLEEGIAEMKRLFVRPSGRGTGLGERLARAAIDHATRAGYQSLRLDTLPSMQRAQLIYRKLGFKDISAYRTNPVAGTVYLELRLK